MTEEHTPDSDVQQPQANPLAEPEGDILDGETIASYPSETGGFQPVSDVSVALDLDALTHDSLNWQEIEGAAQQCIPPEMMETLQAELEEVRRNNAALLDRINHLETALAHSQQALQLYQERQPATEALLSQRLEEINVLREESQHAISEREQSEREARGKQILVETLTEQLEGAHDRVAQLERDCAIAQQRSHEQATQLNQRDKFCIDLQTRLHRQQRYTLQFKNALDRCLQLSESDEKTSDTDGLAELSSPQLTGIDRTLTPKAIAIQPWSAIAEPTSSIEWNSPASQPETLGEGVPMPPVEIAPSIESTEFETSATDQSPMLSLHSSEELMPAEKALEIDAVGNDRTMETPSLGSEWDIPENESADVSRLEDNTDEPTSDSASTEEMITISDREPSISHHSTESHGTESAVNLPQGNWPSPLVYPLRPPKKRKSLAAIELPSFPRS
ncbi:hypothetical protein [Roseofilum casamattae]|uniref:Uncharacterized protein n=1 Tax=Roseofilum casamattae BLCC-M143 TaxID=3022442 RepID=A0ABT7BWA5_9CYAN|nr:hypothetical protein [Roseofilum casamattae]MDJ1182794.1 hypothetical protein [Roseofilum casamattae BLCC-M143]